MYVSIGGIEQWIQVGGEAPDHPVLLYLHGGPGGSAAPLAGASALGKNTSRSLFGTNAGRDARSPGPHKELVSFAGCHHFVVMNRPDAFLNELLGRVRPRI